MSIPRITHMMNLNNGIRASIPRFANVVAIKQNTPIGASFMTRCVIFIIILFDWLKNSLTSCVSSFSMDSIAPTIAANIIIGMMSPLASELIGFAGIMFNRLSVNVTLPAMSDVKLLPTMCKVFPGFIMDDISIARQTDTSTVAR